jgi:hypothetical protein
VGQAACQAEPLKGDFGREEKGMPISSRHKRRRWRETLTLAIGLLVTLAILWLARWMDTHPH